MFNFSLSNWLRPNEQPNQSTSLTSMYMSSHQTTRTGEMISPEIALQNPTVFACVSFLAQSIAQLPWSVVEKDRESFSPVDHKHNKLLNKPNVGMTPFELKYRIVVDLLTHGNCYLLKIETASSVKELIPLDPDKIEAIQLASGKRKYRHEGGKEYDETKIIHIRDFVGGSVQGLSKVKQCANLVAIDNAIDNNLADTFRNGSSLSGVISFSNEVEPEKAEAFIKNWNEKFGENSKGRGGLAVLGNGAEFKQLGGMSPTDADTLKLKQQVMTRIGAVFKVPSYALEIADGSKYANLQSRMTSFYRDSISPITKSISSKLSASLLDDDNLAIAFDAAELIKGDLQSASVIATNAYNSGVLSLNESRSLIGFNGVAEDKFKETNSAPMIPVPNGNEKGPQDN